MIDYHELDHKRWVTNGRAAGRRDRTECAEDDARRILGAASARIRMYALTPPRFVDERAKQAWCQGYLEEMEA